MLELRRDLNWCNLWAPLLSRTDGIHQCVFGHGLLLQGECDTCGVTEVRKRLADWDQRTKENEASVVST